MMCDHIHTIRHDSLLKLIIKSYTLLERKDQEWNIIIQQIITRNHNRVLTEKLFESCSQLIKD